MWTAATAECGTITTGASAFDPADLARAPDPAIFADWYDAPRYHRGGFFEACLGPARPVSGATSRTKRTKTPAARLELKPQAPAAETPANRTEHFRFSLSATALSEYRRAGTSRSDGHPAFIGGGDLSAPRGWSAGVRAVVADRVKSNVEVALYGAKTVELGQTELSLGATAVVYLDGPDDDFGFAQASVSRAIGPVDATLAINYAWTQHNLDDEDNLYVVVRARTPIGRLYDIPVTLNASVGRMAGHFAMADSRVDWSVGLTGNIRGTDIGLTYTDTDLDDPRGDPAVVLSITHRS